MLPKVSIYVYGCSCIKLLYNTVLRLGHVASCGEAQGLQAHVRGFEFNVDVWAPSHRRLIDASMSAFGTARVDARVPGDLEFFRCRWVDRQVWPAKEREEKSEML